MTSRRALRGDRRGSVGVTIAFALPLLIGAGALAVDVGSVQLEARRLQGIADAAAMAAATDPANAQARASTSITNASYPRPISVVATAGTYRRDATVALASRFTAGGSTPDAARVVVTTRSPTFLARIFGMNDVEVTRTATAQRQRLAAFSIGSRLASVNGGLVNAYLGALTGSNLSLSAMDYNALASADVDLFAFLPFLRSRAGAQVLTFDQLAATQITAPQLLNALADTLAASGAGAGASAIRTVAAGVSGSRSIQLNSLIDLGPVGRQGTGGTGLVRINALSLLTALLQNASNNRQVQLDAGATIPGLASTKLTLAVGDRVQQSPWIAIGDAGKVTVRTAQTRAYIETVLAPTAIAGLSGLISVKVPLFLELAAGEGRVTDIACPTWATRSVGLEARTSPGSLSLGQIDPSLLSNFSQPVTPVTAHLIDLPLVDVYGSSRIDLGGAEPWQQLRFDAAAIENGTVQTVRSSSVVGGAATSLMARSTVTVSLLGLPLPLSPLIGAVGGVLTLAAPALDGLLGLVTGTLGVGIGEADLRVTGIRCGMAVLVA